MVIFYQGVWDKTITPTYTGYYEGSAGVSGNNIKLNIYWGHFSGGQVSFSFDATGFTTYTVNLSATDGKPPITVKVGSVSKTVYTSSRTTVVLDISSLSGMQSCLIKYANGEYNNGTDSAYISKIEAT